MTTKSAKVEVYKDTADEWRWRIVAGNGRTLADSGEGYKRKARCIEMASKIATELPVVLV